MCLLIDGGIVPQDLLHNAALGNVIDCCAEAFVGFIIGRFNCIGIEGEMKSLVLLCQNSDELGLFNIGEPGLNILRVDVLNLCRDGAE